MENSADIIIVGAGPVGIYFGWQLAKEGYSVLIIERDTRENTGSKMDQFHLEKHVFKTYGIPPPEEGTDEFITEFKWTSYYGPYGKFQQVMEYPIIAMRFQFFIHRLIGLAEKDGVNFQFSSEFQEPIIEDNSVVGVITKVNNEAAKFQGKLIVDTTGSNAVVRRSLPEEIGNLESKG